jgi:glucokinase
MRCCALDIGGSSVKNAVCEVSSSDARVIMAYPPVQVISREFAALREIVARCVENALENDSTISVVTISTTGAVDRSGRVLSAGFFSGYEDVSWDEILQQRFPRLSRVLTVNDGRASTWAEYCGRARGCEVFTHFVVGTGVGGGIVCFDKILYGDDETAGALGHMKVSLESKIVCSCGRMGCVETLAAGPAIVRGYAAATARKVGTLDAVATAAVEGDPVAVRAFEEAGGWLGVALGNVINILNPRYITVGGGVIDASMRIDVMSGGPYLNAAVRRATELAFEDIAADTRIEMAKYGNNGGLVGAALLAMA